MIIFPDCCQIVRNKYYEWYCRIIESNCSRKLVGVYTERHHIIPKSIEKVDDIIRLTAREHFIVHLLLTKFVLSQPHLRSLTYSLWGMCNQMSAGRDHYVNSRTYAAAKSAFIAMISGDNHWMKSPEMRKRMSELHKGVPLSEETKKKISLAFLGRKCLWKDKIGLSNKGKRRTEEMNSAQSEMMKERYALGIAKNPMKGVCRPKSPCQYCGQTIDVANMKKWHTETSNCKERLQKRLKLPGKRGLSQNRKRNYPTVVCEVCGKSYTKHFYKKVHLTRCQNLHLTT